MARAKRRIASRPVVAFQTPRRLTLSKWRTKMRRWLNWVLVKLGHICKSGLVCSHRSKRNRQLSSVGIPEPTDFIMARLYGGILIVQISLVLWRVFLVTGLIGIENFKKIRKTVRI
jgi:hypothetical protein